MTMFTRNIVEHDYNMVSSKQQIKVNVFHLYNIRYMIIDFNELYFFLTLYINVFIASNSFLSSLEFTRRWFCPTSYNTIQTP